MPVSHRTSINKKHTAMRVIGAWVDAEREQERFLRCRMNELAVGSADFDHLLKATVGEAYLRVLRHGGTPEDARTEAADDGNDCVKRWNEKVHKTRAYILGPYELQRWGSAGEAEADGVHIRYLSLLRA